MYLYEVTVMTSGLKFTKKVEPVMIHQFDPEPDPHCQFLCEHRTGNTVMLRRSACLR